MSHPTVFSLSAFSAKLIGTYKKIKKRNIILFE